MMLGGVDFYVSILNTDLSPSETNERERVRGRNVGWYLSNKFEGKTFWKTRVEHF